MVIEAVLVLGSWYGTPFLGRKTASGEVFVSYKMTAAVKGFPIGGRPYYVLVRRNGKKLRVRVNDRCPLNRIDLSPAAAKYLGIDGIGMVTVARIPEGKLLP